MTPSRPIPPPVDPLPPVVRGRVPWVRAGLPLLRDPTQAFVRARAQLGDTFYLEAFGYRLFCVFSPAGVRALYALPEHEASFGLATYRLVFEHKLPLELVSGRRNRPHDLFGNEEVDHYLRALEHAVGQELSELATSGRFEIFEECRRLGHRLALAAWAGPEASSPRYLRRLIPLFDRLDSAASFVHPAQAFRSALTNKADERRAMRGIEVWIGDILRRRARGGARPSGSDGPGPDGDFLGRIERTWADLPLPERATQVARDVIMLQLGAQSNLYAAMAWTLTNLLLHPEYLAPVRAGDDALLERCANESIRMAQRSLTLREVVRPIEIEDEEQRYRIAPGVLVATMLSVTNTTAGPDLDRFDPGHYEGRRLAPSVEVEGRERVSTFGHGRHSCPAQRFSITAIRVAVRALLDRYDFEPEFTHAAALARQIGGVARAAGPCRVRYRLRDARV